MHQRALSIGASWRFVGGREHGSIETLAAEVLDVFHDGFGLRRGETSYGLSNARALVRGADLYAVLRDESSRRLLGYAAYRCPHAPLGDGHVVWEDAVTLRRSVHGRGLASAILGHAIGFFRRQGRRPVWLGGRTQNLLVVQRYDRRRPFGPVWPFDENYTSLAGDVIGDFLEQHVPQVGSFGLERATGLLRGAYVKAYGRGRLAEDPDSSDPRFLRFEAHLKGCGFDRDAGDAVAVLVQI